MNCRRWSSASLVSSAAARPWDTPITRAGEELALQKGQHIASTMIEKFPHYKNVARVYCSPFLRCVQTLSIMIPSLPRGPEPLDICVEPSVCEFMAAEWWAEKPVIFCVDSVRLGMHRGAFPTLTAHGVPIAPANFLSLPCFLWASFSSAAQDVQVQRELQAPNPQMLSHRARRPPFLLEASCCRRPTCSPWCAALARLIPTTRLSGNAAAALFNRNLRLSHFLSSSAGPTKRCSTHFARQRQLSSSAFDCWRGTSLCLPPPYASALLLFCN